MKNTKRILSLLLVLSMVLGLFATAAVAAPANGNTNLPVTVEGMQVEYMTTPLGLDVTTPRFSWSLSSEARDVVQESYRLVVADSEENLTNGDYVWDTGVVSGSTTNGVTYAGTALKPTTRYYWQVTAATSKGEAVAKSWWETGLMNTSLEAWDGAQWITDPAEAEEAAVDNYVIEWDFSMVYDGASLRFASDGGYYLVWQFNINAVERPYGGTPYFRPHVWNTGGACLKDIKIDHVIPDNDEGKHAWYHCTVDVTKKDGVYYATTELGPVGGEMTVIDDNRALPTGHNWSVGKLGFRQISDSNNKDDAYFDNIKITDKSTDTVIYNETFSESTVPAMFAGHGVIENGTYRLGGKSHEFEAAYSVLEGPEKDDLGQGEPLFRKSFTVDAEKTVASARLYATARGVYEFSLNGQKVGDQYLAPGWTDYNYTLMYQTYDITDMLQSGENVVGAVLGQGWWSSPEQGASNSYTYGKIQSLLGKLVVTYTDGSQEIIVTDDSWVSRPGPVQYADNYAGEEYDARYDCEGWNTVDYDASSWKTVGIEAPMDASVELVAQTGEPIREVGRFSDPVVTEPVAGHYTFDFGQNISGFIRIKVKGEAGTKLTIKHAEMLNTEVAYKKDGVSVKGGDGLPGTIYRANLRDSFARGKKVAIDYYTLKGEEDGEVWMPTFTFHGFRYVEITGLESLDQLLEIEAIAISSDNEITATLETSNAKLNQLFSNVIWGMRGNFVSVPTDCPNRDERLGYTGDTQIFAGTGVYMANSNQFYSKWLRDLRDYQLNETSGNLYGKVPVIIPMNNWTGGWPSNWSSAWGNAAVIVPWQLYQQYNDTQIIRAAFDSMKAWCDFQMDPDRTTNYLRKGGSASGGDNNYGDWLAVEASDKSLTNSLYMAYDFRNFSIMARAIGETEIADEYEETGRKIVAAIMDKWGNEEGDLLAASQTPLALFLHFGLADLSDTANPELIAERLKDNVEAHGNKLTTGFIGVNALLPALSENGQMDTAMTLLEQEEYPSWLYSVNQGATTTWERWDSFTLDRGFDSSGMNSFNHYAYGAVGEWMMSGLLGIRRDEANPGFTHFYLDPSFGGSLTYAKGSYTSVSGTIEAGWEMKDGTFRYDVTVPANTTATLYLPADSADAITEGGVAAAEAEGVRFVSYDKSEGRAVYELASGSYSFSAAKTIKTKYAVSLKVTDSIPVEAEVTMNDEVKKVVLPASMMIEEGTQMTVKATAMNYVDYEVIGWKTEDDTVTEANTISFTVDSAKSYEVTTKYIGITSLAVGKKVTADAVNGDWAAKNLTDGILTKEGGTNGWSSPMHGQSLTFDEVTAVIDLGVKTQFNQIRLYPRYISGYGCVSFPVSYTVYTSDDNATWTPIYSVTDGEATNGYAPSVVNLEKMANARYVKLGVTKINRTDDGGNSYVQICEMGLYNIRANAASIRVQLESERGTAPVQAQVKVNDELVADSLPVNLQVVDGDQITVTAQLLNPVDYTMEEATLNHTVKGDATLTMKAKWSGKENLAAGKKVTADAVNGDWAASNLTDGKLSYLDGTNGWSSVKQGKNITTFEEVDAVIDLGEATSFDTIHLYPRNLPSLKEDVGVMNCPTAYTFYVSDDNATWTQIYTTANGEVSNGFAPVVIALDKAVSARYVKFACTAVNHGDENGDAYVQLSELALYLNGTAVDEDKLAAEAVEKKIAAIGEVTLESAASIAEARNAYDTLTKEQQALVSNYAVLEAAEAAYDALTKPVEKQDVQLVITGAETVGMYEEAVTYKLSAKNMKRLADVKLTIAISEETLAEPVAIAAEGWMIIAQSYENGVLTVVAGNLTGADGDDDILSITAKPAGEPGQATVEVTRAVLAAYTEDAEVYVTVDLTAAKTTTEVVFSLYDVNHDGVVDMLDLTRAQRFYGTANATCDVNHDGTVDIADLILIVNNYTEPF